VTEINRAMREEGQRATTVESERSGEGIRALRRRDTAGRAVPTVCPDVERLCDKLKLQDPVQTPALKVRHRSFLPYRHEGGMNKKCRRTTQLGSIRCTCPAQVLGLTTTTKRNVQRRDGLSGELSARIPTAAMNSASLDLLLNTLIEFPGNIQ
jgi:hypothetical protein